MDYVPQAEPYRPNSFAEQVKVLFVVAIFGFVIVSQVATWLFTRLFLFVTDVLLGPALVILAVWLAVLFMGCAPRRVVSPEVFVPTLVDSYAIVTYQLPYVGYFSERVTWDGHERKFDTTGKAEAWVRNTFTAAEKELLQVKIESIATVRVPNTETSGEPK